MPSGSSREGSAKGTPGTGETADFAAVLECLADPESADIEVLEAIERQVSTAEMESARRAEVLFGLAVAWQARGDPARAFALADWANQIEKLEIAYDPVAEERRVTHLIRVFGPEMMVRCQGYGIETERPLFIVGICPAGTALCEAMLAGHPAVFGAGALPVIPDELENLAAWQRRLGSTLGYPDCLWDLTRRESREMALRVMVEQEVLLPPEQAVAVRRIADAQPDNFLNVGLIKLLFPQARILHVTRDLRDAAVSAFFANAARQPGRGYTADLEWTGRRLRDHDRLMRHWRDLFADTMLDVAWEDLVARPQQTARAVLSFLGLRWDPAVLRALEASELSLPAQSWRAYAHWLTPFEVGLAQVPFEASGASAPPAWPPGRFETALTALDGGDDGLAGRLCAEVLEEFPDHAAAHYLRGLALARQGYLEAALDHLQRAVDRQPDHADWRDAWSRVRHCLADARKGQVVADRLATLTAGPSVRRA